MAYPYSTREVVADAAIHAIGITAAIPASVVLVLYVAQAHDPAEIAAVAIYASLMTLALLVSAAYHLLPWEGPRPWLLKLDHAAIYLKIAGTYTPLVVLMGSLFGYVVLTAVWVVALGGAVAKLSFWRTDARGSLALYLAMGWAAVLLAYQMWALLPAATSALIALGGGLYTLGTVFFAAQQMRYQNAIWHGFVFMASLSFFAAIAIAVTQ